MNITTVDVEINKNYLFLEIDPTSSIIFKYTCLDKPLLFNKQDYELLKYCTLNKITEKIRYPFHFYRVSKEISSKYKYWLNKTCYFHDENNNCYIKDWIALYGHVFKNIEDYLIHLTKTKLKMEKKPYHYIKSNNSVNIEFDDFLKDKIKESQEKNPDKWIF